MKKIIFILLFVSIIFLSGCTEEAPEEEIEPEVQEGVQTEITAKLGFMPDFDTLDEGTSNITYTWSFGTEGTRYVLVNEKKEFIKTTSLESKLFDEAKAGDIVKFKGIPLSYIEGFEKMDIKKFEIKELELITPASEL